MKPVEPYPTKTTEGSHAVKSQRHLLGIQLLIQEINVTDKEKNTKQCTILATDSIYI